MELLHRETLRSEFESDWIWIRKCWEHLQLAEAAVDFLMLRHVDLRLDLRHLPPPSSNRETVCLGIKPHETHDQNFFSQLNPCDISPYATSSLTRGWVCLLWMCLTFRQVYVSHMYSTLLKKSWFSHYTQALCQYRLSGTDHAYLTYLMLQRLPSHLNGRKLDHRQAFPIGSTALVGPGRLLVSWSNHNW
jgi:hypothetical protein